MQKNKFSSILFYFLITVIVVSAFFASLFISEKIDDVFGQMAAGCPACLCNNASCRAALSPPCPPMCGPCDNVCPAGCTGANDPDCAGQCLQCTCNTDSDCTNTCAAGDGCCLGCGAVADPDCPTLPPGSCENTIPSSCACPAGIPCPGGQCEGGLVPCGRSCDDPSTKNCECAPCTLCHLFVLFKRIVDFLTINVIFPLAILMIVIGGVMFLTSAGDLGKIGTAKKILTATVIGLLIILAAWLIVDTVIALLIPGASPFRPWNTINCPVCGDGTCDPGETNANCPTDCHCGDGTCDPGETLGNCPADCHCGDGNCDPEETLGNCPADCSGGAGGCGIPPTCSNCNTSGVCTGAGCKWCWQCSGYLVNSWKTDTCIDPAMSCGYTGSCISGYCGAPADCTVCSIWDWGLCQCKPSACCLKESSLVLTPDGFKTIEDLKEGDYVIGYNNGERVKSKVLTKSEHTGEFNLYFYKGYWFTGNHLIYLDDYKDFKLASELSNITQNYQGKVYNIQTETKNYFGENNLLIHNK